jgi:hypothetical protein
MRESADSLRRRADDAQVDECARGEHDWQNACSVFFEIYQSCAHCGVRRPLRTPTPVTSQNES